MFPDHEAGILNIPSLQFAVEVKILARHKDLLCFLTRTHTHCHSKE